MYKEKTVTGMRLVCMQREFELSEKQRRIEIARYGRGKANFSAWKH